MRLLILTLCAVSLLAGCQIAAPQFSKPDSSWKTQVGQLQYRVHERSIIGDCVMSSHGADEFQLEFKVGPGFPLMRLWCSPSRVRAEGALARGNWDGAPDKVPARLAGWLQIAQERRRAADPNHWRFEAPATAEQFAWASGQ